ncbi:MAG: M23 family metallopeptidase [Desulfofustis sp.]|nr:M23 family metallopeptidase [Desulfofustis sp.]
MSRLRHSKSRSKSTFLIFFFLLLTGCGAVVFFLFFEGEKPNLALDSPLTYLGKNSLVEISAADNKSGLRQLRVKISQGEVVKELYLEQFPRKGVTGVVGEPQKMVKIPFNPAESGFKDGPAQIVLEAYDYSLRGLLKGNRTSISKELSIDTTPPKVSVLHSEQYINPGGTGIAIYRLTDPEITSGVQINDRFHPGFLVGDGRDDTFISFFALHYSANGLDSSFVVATDPAGNTTRIPFSVVFKKKKFRQDRINVSDGFLDKKIPEFMQYYPEMAGTMVDKYLYTNNEIRIKNNNKISELCGSPHNQRLWEGKFYRMPGSSRAGFADHRTYYYGDKPIDRQVHLGIDLASTRKTEVKAAEAGIVIFADYLGIYGNMVMIDHGQGVFSLYSHLSQIDVVPNDQVNRGIVIGLTGTTGMAGGDHLHFSMLINGVFVTPKEWWDQNWIDVTIEDPLTESRFQ